MALDPITDYSRTQRIVLLVDLNPLLHLQNPTPYLTSIISSSKILLYFPPFSSSTLFAFKLFLSSLSPLLSSSRLHSLIPGGPISSSFNQPNATFESLSNVLHSLSNLHQSPLCDSPDSMLPQASSLAASLRQLLHDYVWDPVIGDSESGTLSESYDWIGVRSNLVVLFSPFPKSDRCLSGLLSMAADDECMRNVNLFDRKICGIFGRVNDAFERKDIQISWIDVRYESSEKKIEDDDLKLKFRFLESGLRNLGWGFCSTDSMVLGSALLPFGLIYPKIGMTSRNFDLDEFQKKIQAKLHLQILDKSGKPLDCKFCDLELIDWKILPESRPLLDIGDSLLGPGLSTTRTEGRRKISLEFFGDGVSNLHVKGVQRCSDLVKYKSHLSDPFLVREFSEVSAKNTHESNGNFFADEVLTMLELELGDSKKPKSIPVFQLLLSSLYREGYCAVVSISDGNGGTHLGILMPFMVSSALLSVIDNEFYHHELEPDNEDRNLKESDTKKESMISKLNVDLNRSCSSVDYEASPSIRCSQNGEDKRKEKKKTRQLIQDFTWRDFYTAAFDHLKIELEEAYFDRYRNSSKKLKFLQCWVKQIKKSTICSLMLLETSQFPEEILVQKGDRLTQLQQESEELATSSALASDKEISLRSQAEPAIDYRSETSEDFFNNLSSKIQQGLESEVVNLGALAERLVSSIIFWLNQTHDVQGTSDHQQSAGKSDTTNGCTIAAELNKLLLREPKDVIAKPKNNGLSADDCRPESTTQAPENIVREHELQIFFRMEILRSAIGFSIGESMKQKFVKHICLLLETIQCHLEGGFFGEWSLENYVGTIIKSRYCQSLGVVVHKIYEKMDLLLFAEENESLNHLLNSEDSNRSLRENPESDEVGDNYSSNDQVSAETKLHEDGSEWPLGIKSKYTCKLIEAQERREKARKYACFSSWVPDLQRVWAPKQQPKRRKPKLNNHQKASKRKYHSRESSDKVCETPLTEKRHSFRRESKIGDEDAVDSRDRLCGSVSKALFKDMDSEHF